jgi:hypothetical protein
MEDHRRSDILAKQRMGDRERDRLGDGRVAKEHFVHFSRRDLLAAAVDISFRRPVR